MSLRTRLIIAFLGLQELLATEHEQGITTLLERVEQAVRTFRGNAEPFDDATMMALRVNA